MQESTSPTATENLYTVDIGSRIMEAMTDLREWIQLAERQREKMDQNLGWCPTQHGIDRSKRILKELSWALTLAKVVEKELLDLRDAVADQ